MYHIAHTGPPHVGTQGSFHSNITANDGAATGNDRAGLSIFAGLEAGALSNIANT